MTEEEKQIERKKETDYIFMSQEEYNKLCPEEQEEVDNWRDWAYSKMY
jgi:hypothetical protein